ncbi:ABC transporter [Phytophthora megakarya]|uniref:ABC transporter n=1 Tax=Phytophthora megakarya TaxID=4795 RepID=A0A225VH22_9STRA|nr:ABC transporter [Phytophthora megakarya]
MVALVLWYPVGFMSGSESEAHVPPATVYETSPVSEEWHEAWKAFKDYVKVYETETHQLFRMRSSTLVDHRTKEILDQAGVDLTHSLGSQKPKRSQRKSNFYKSTKYKTDIKAAVTWNDLRRYYGSNNVHNHRVAQALYDNHSAVYHVEDPVMLVFVDMMQSAGSEPKQIMQFLARRQLRKSSILWYVGKNATLRDVHNMVAIMRETRRGSDTVKQRLEPLLRRFCQCLSVFVDDLDVTQTITIQTHQMRRWFKAFTEVLLVDATHNTNESKYKLFSFIIHDSALTVLVNAFKFSNPSWDQVRIIIIDKNMGELSMLRSHFQTVKVIMCHFHLKKYIRLEIAKTEYGGPGSYIPIKRKIQWTNMRMVSMIDDTQNSVTE